MTKTKRLAAALEILDTHLLVARNLILQSQPQIGSDIERAAARLTHALQALDQIRREA